MEEKTYCIITMTGAGRIRHFAITAETLCNALDKYKTPNGETVIGAFETAQIAEMIPLFQLLQNVRAVAMPVIR